MSRMRNAGGRRRPRAHSLSVFALEGRTLLSASPRIDRFTVPNPSSSSDRLAIGPDGNLWFTEAGKVGRLTPQGQVTEFTVPTPAGGDTPAFSGITAGPNDAIWVLDYANGQVDEISVDGQVKSFPIPGGSDDPTSFRTFGSIVAGADGNLWFGESLNGMLLSGWGPSGAIVPGSIDRITPDGVVTAFPLPTGGVAATSIAAGPDGVWFTDPAANRVGRVDSSGHVVEFGAASPRGVVDTSLTVGPDGDAYYVADHGSSSFIVKVSPDGATTPIAVPGNVGKNLLTGPDGVYFWWGAGVDSSSFARLNADGTLTTVLSLPSLEQAFSDDQVFGPDGNLWSLYGDVISRVVLTSAPVPGPTLVVGGPAPIQPFEGGPTASALVAPAGESAPLDLAVFRHSADVSTVSATVDWGDGSPPTAGVLDTGTDLGFDPDFVDGRVSGTHAYAQAGDYTVTVTVEGTGPDGTAMSAATVETVKAVAPSPSPSSPPLVLQAGQSTAFQGAVAGFTTPTPHDASATDFTATIDWGDGSPTTAGTVSAGFPESFYGDSPTGPAYDFYVSGGYTYATAGTFNVVVTLTDASGHSSTESTPIQVVAGPLAVSGSIAPPIGMSQDASISFQGTLTDFDGTVAGRTYSATVDWGDGSPPTVATVMPRGPFGFESTGPATFGFSDSHVYAQGGDYTVRVTVEDNEGHSAESTTTVHASASAFGLTTAYTLGSPAAGGPIPITPLASILAHADGASASDFTATVDWGDGSPTIAGTVVAGNSGIGQPGRQFTVSGGHTYASSGLYNLTITVKGPDGSTSTTTTPIEVSLASAENGTAAEPIGGFLSGIAGAPVPLATFSASAFTASATDFRATVDWGDGSLAQAATIQALGASWPLAGFSTNFNVVAGHNYANPGVYTATVTVVGADGLPEVITVALTATAPAPTTATPSPIDLPGSTPTTTSTPSPATPASGPTVISYPLAKFAPPVVRHHYLAAHFKAAKHPAATPSRRSKPKSAHHAATKPAHVTPAKTHPVGPARKARLG